MTLPRFFSRVNDAIGPLLAAGTGGGADVKAFLSDKSVLLQASDDLDQHPFHAAGFLLVVNLCARLYPRIRVVAPKSIREESRALALRINPACDFDPDEGTSTAALAWCCEGRVSGAIVVAPVGWEVLIDLPDARRIQATNMLASLAAGALGAALLFRQVFAEFLPKGRTAAEPGRFNVLTHGPTSATLPDLPSDIPLGRVHLVGAGAVGQAAIYALTRISATGTITVIDPETIALSNLQRYVLSFDADEGVSKCAIVERELSGTRLQVVAVEAPWSIDLADTSDAQTVCAAVDSDDLRIALQAALPQKVYNAWTQPDDIGWSRHEQFGVEPCVACLYWPTRPRPNYHELVARALRQPELRVLAHLASKAPVDIPLKREQIPILAAYPMPAEAVEWSSRSLLEDVAAALGIDESDVAAWKGRALQDLYREGICAGALIRKQVSEVPVEMAVPLAHQSVLAGIMLAAQLVVAARPELLAHRPQAVESRLDLLSPLPQIAFRPRQLTPGCVCSDADFVDHFRKKWPYSGAM